MCHWELASGPPLPAIRTRWSLLFGLAPWFPGGLPVCHPWIEGSVLLNSGLEATGLTASWGQWGIHVAPISMATEGHHEILGLDPHRGPADLHRSQREEEFPGLSVYGGCYGLSTGLSSPQRCTVTKDLVPREALLGSSGNLGGRCSPWKRVLGEGC